MFAVPQNGCKAQQSLDGKRHCVLVSASNPYPLPTPVYRPAIENLEQGENGEAQTENLLYDAETVAKWFGQVLYQNLDLSVSCPFSYIHVYIFKAMCIIPNFGLTDCSVLSLCQLFVQNSCQSLNQYIMR